MKKTLILLLLSLLLTNLSAQELRFSVVAEPQLTWMKPDAKNVASEGSRFGINVGLQVDKFFAPNYALSSGISIGTTGGELQYDDELVVKIHGDDTQLPAGSVVTYKLQYINIPLGLKLKTNPIGYSTFYAHLGLLGGVNIKATGNANSDLLSDENISDDIRLLKMGYFIGGGVEYSLGGASSLIIGISYNNGFSDITKREKNKATLSNVALRLGILF
ncbi:MAG: porin family protein [Bacteroidales bacterium]|jgi:hypothetical protein